MPTGANRERDPELRLERILVAARDLAEREGWEAVTTRRLADAIDYSQPVLYGHFPGGKAEIVDAVAIRGFVELTAALKPGRSTNPVTRVRRLITAYLDFAFAHPAVYAAMFAMPIAVRFATTETPAELRAGFDVIRATLDGNVSHSRDPGISAEVLWAAMHGLATLEAAGRLPATSRRKRIDDLTALVTA